jgi:hypothetical protein
MDFDSFVTVVSVAARRLFDDASFLISGSRRGTS